MQAVQVSRLQKQFAFDRNAVKKSLNIVHRILF